MQKKEELINKVGEKAYQNEQKYGGCAQSVVGAFKELIGDRISDNEFKAATGLAGGIGLMGSSCGALTGAVMVLSNFLGREYNNFSDPNKVRFKTFKLSKELVERFNEEYNSVICNEIRKKIMGKDFNLWDKQEYKKFLAAGGHDDKCPSVCRNAAKWAMEILIKEDLLIISCINKKINK